MFKKIAILLVAFSFMFQMMMMHVVFAETTSAYVVVTTQQELRSAISSAGTAPLTIVVNDTINVGTGIEISNGRDITIQGEGTLVVSSSNRHFIVQRTGMIDSSLTLAGDITLTRSPGFNGFGGGVRVDGNSERLQFPGHTGLTLRDNAAIVNNASIHYGGGVYLQGATLSLHHNSRIEHNTAFLNGGGISASSGARNSIYMFDNSSISHNEAGLSPTSQFGYGGGIDFGELDHFFMNGGVMTGNSARQGGAINTLQGSSQLYMINGQMTHNRATVNGGAINTTSYTVLLIEDGMLFDGNQASNWFNYGLSDGLVSFPNIRWSGDNSIPGTHLLNNYDINFTGRTAPLENPPVSTEPTTVDVTEPATEDETNPTTVDVTEPATGGETNPTTVDVTEPATGDETNPTTVDVTEPATGD
ncbi:MAG: hypothetical protein FWG67_01575, partial [Defluviitaleaceae bacterium]|nr:hypothetical protein [Defluviitaleaceae bacterium]